MNQDKWRQFFQKSNKHIVWVKVMLNNNRHYFFHDHKNWLSIKEDCDKENLYISELELQFRSHRVIIEIPEDSEGVYFVPSVMGVVGAKTKSYFTVGVLKKDLVYKKMYLIPELVIDKEMTDDISQCFTEALIYNEKTQENRQE